MVLKDEVIAAVAAGTPVDDRERDCIEQFLGELDRLGDDPFNEHDGPVHVTTSAVIVGTRGVVLHRHRLLGIWVAPGGHIDRGENPWDAAVREATEETGLAVRHVAGVPSLVHVDVHAGPDHMATPISTCATCSKAVTPIRPHHPMRARKSPGSRGPKRSPSPSPAWPASCATCRQQPDGRDHPHAAPLPARRRLITFLPLPDLVGLADADGTSCGVLVDGSLSMTAFTLGADFHSPGEVTARAAAVPASDDVPPEGTNARARSSTRW